MYKCEDFYIAQKCNFITVNFDPLPRVNVYRGQTVYILFYFLDVLKISRGMLCLLSPHAIAQNFDDLFLLFSFFRTCFKQGHSLCGPRDGHCDVIGIILPRDPRGVMMLLTSPILIYIYIYISSLYNIVKVHSVTCSRFKVHIVFVFVVGGWAG